MSRLSSLLRQVEQQTKNPELVADLEREYRALSSRRAFGLNFERHTPETVQLPGRPVRVGDKVAFLPPRHPVPDAEPPVDKNLWTVIAIDRSTGSRVASLRRRNTADEEPVTASRPVEDLVVVAGFRDPIFPGLVSTGRIERGGDKPFHAVINAENYHALQTLLFTHEGKVDAIYIDPPYNTGATDWKYNNDYVDENDQYRHSKWLAFMERRLKLARRLLNPDRSVLIVTIDDKELNRLALLLEQVFPDATSMQMVTSVINPRGKYHAGEFARCEEYIFFVTFGSATVQGEPDEDYAEGASIAWRTFRRSDITSKRGTAKGGTQQFYPIYVTEDGRVHSLGDALPHDVPRSTAPAIAGCTAVFPMRDDGTEMNWGLTAASARLLLEQGYLRIGAHTPSKPQQWEVSYLTSGRIGDIASGRAAVTGRNPDGSVIAKYVTHKVKMPVSTWNRPTHNAEVNGTELVKTLLGEKAFPYPKALYAVEDALRLFIGDHPEALVVDFFSGSGTTCHAVMRLNRQDGGRRRSICVTNNEVSEIEAATLRARGLRPGDAEWEALGICDYVTKPRIRAAVTGQTASGRPIQGDYKAPDVFPMREGFEENVEFFTLTYEAPRAVAHNRSFERIAPLLWLRAGAEGSRIDTVAEVGWQMADTYGVLFDLDEVGDFLQAVQKNESARMVYVVTDDQRAYQMVCEDLPDGVEPVRLYESYLTNFTINTGRE